MAPEGTEKYIYIFFFILGFKEYIITTDFSQKLVLIVAMADYGLS